MAAFGVVVTGADGRMGRRLVADVAGADGLELVGATERAGSDAIGRDAGRLAGLDELGVAVDADLETTLSSLGAAAKVVIDFTSPQASAAHAVICARHRVALVVGATGFDEESRRQVESAAETVPIVMAPNMSVGVNALFLLVRRAAQILGESYDVEILEAHHRMKKDAPSGTAVRLGEIAAEALGRDLQESAVYGRQGQVGARTQSEIGMMTLRGGDVTGEHTVYFFGEGERLELTHRATSREVFAQGAIRAAGWVVGREPGLYGMEHVLELG